MQLGFCHLPRAGNLAFNHEFWHPCSSLRSVSIVALAIGEHLQAGEHEGNTKQSGRAICPPARRTQRNPYRFNAATPGSSIPARNSSEAPPPVETWLIFDVTPAALIAFSESPPPTTLVAPDSATALASAT